MSTALSIDRMQHYRQNLIIVTHLICKILNISATTASQLLTLHT